MGLLGGLVAYLRTDIAEAVRGLKRFYRGLSGCFCSRSEELGLARAAQRAT